MIEVRVDLEVGDTDGGTTIHIARTQSVMTPTMPPTPDRRRAYAELILQALERVVGEALEEARDQGKDYAIIMARPWSEEEDP